MVLAHGSETEDTFIADLSVGLATVSIPLLMFVHFYVRLTLSTVAIHGSLVLIGCGCVVVN